MIDCSILPSKSGQLILLFFVMSFLCCNDNSLLQKAEKNTASETDEIKSEAKVSGSINQKNSTKIFVDTKSKLVWQRVSINRNMNWESAKKYCENMTLAGYEDWRLPSLSEIRTLIRGCPATEIGSQCRAMDSCPSWDNCRTEVCEGCKDKSSACYWPKQIEGRCNWYYTSTPDSTKKGDAWNLDFQRALIGTTYTWRKNYVRCVRFDK